MVDGLGWDGGAAGALLVELNRILRPGGYFVWSATPVYQNDEEHKKMWAGERGGSSVR